MVPPLLVTYARGICMGMADAIPGVSGGTVALILGIYDRLVAAIGELSVETVLAVGRGVLDGSLLESDSEAREAIDRLDVPFLLALGSGMVTAVVALTRVITFADEAYPVAMFALFSGLIGASGLALLREVRPFDRAEATVFVVGVVVAFLVSGVSGTDVPPSLPVIFLAGVIALSAMVMPGLSGSLLLILFGQYTYLSRTLTEFVDGLVALASGGDLAVVLDRGIVVVTFVAGGALGVLTVARIVNRALERNRSVTVAFLVGLVIGALRAPLREIGGEVPDAVELGVGVLAIEVWPPRVLAVVLAWGAVGAIALLLVDRYLYRIQV